MNGTEDNAGDTEGKGDKSDKDDKKDEKEFTNFHVLGFECFGFWCQFFACNVNLYSIEYLADRN